MIEIERPSFQTPDQYELRVDEEMLMFMEQGALHNTEQLMDSIRAHKDCNLRDEDGCKLSQARLIATYGSLEQARDVASMYAVDCSEDLAYVYSALSKQMQFLFQSRYLRSVRDHTKALPSRPTTTAVAVAKPEEGTLLGLNDRDTGMIPKVVDEEAQVEEKPLAVDDYEPRPAEGPQHRLKGKIK